VHRDRGAERGAEEQLVWLRSERVWGGLDHAPLEVIVGQIRAIGVNSVRLPWANETLERNPVVADYGVKANPRFRGKRALDVMDGVIAALARARIMVILDAIRHGRRKSGTDVSAFP
jgi:endoglucanase